MRLNVLTQILWFRQGWAQCEDTGSDGKCRVGQSSPACVNEPLMLLFRPHLHFLDHLLAERADLGGAGDGHVLGALVLAGDTIKGCGVVLHVVIQVRLAKRHQKNPITTCTVNTSETGTYFKRRECVRALDRLDLFYFSPTNLETRMEDSKEAKQE